MTFEPFQTTHGDLQTSGLPYQPLPHIRSVSTFDQSNDGWRNHSTTEDSLAVRSRMPEPTIGDFGPMTGKYALKLTTTTYGSGTARLVKRNTMPWFGTAGGSDLEFPDQVRYETVFAFAPAPENSTEDLATIQFEMDTENDSGRFWPAVYWLGWDSNGNKRAVWEVNEGGAGTKNGIKVGEQDLCYNEPYPESADGPFRRSWHYFRMDVDLKNNQYIDFQCNDRQFDLSDFSTTTDNTTEFLRGLLNPMAAVKANGSARANLLLDSAVISSAGGDA